MSRYYLRWLLEDGTIDETLETVGPYPTAKMAEFMSGTYEALFKRKAEVVEVND